MLGLSLSLTTQRNPLGGAATPPDAPTGFALGTRTDTTLGFTWDALPAGVTARIMWRQSTGNWGEFEQSGLNFAGYNITSLTNNTSYDVRIRAETNGGLASDWVTLTDIFTYPSAPSNFAAATSVYGAVNLSWDFQVGVTWKLYRDGSMEVYSGADTQHVDDTGSPNQVFGYALKAIGNISGLECALTDTVYGTSGAGSVPINITPPSMPGAVPYTVSLGEWTADPDIYTQTTYQWYKDGIEDPSANTESYMPTEAGDYYCGVTRANVVGWSETAFTISQTYTPP